MKINFKMIFDSKIPAAKKKINNAGEKALKNTIVAIAADSIKGSPVLTGNNRRSIKYEVKGMSGAVYSTSGYGGFLETGTSRRTATPYFKPALDKNLSKLPDGIKAELKHG